MEAMSAAKIASVDADEVAARGEMRLRPDAGPQIALENEREQFAPSMRDGFFMVPRLATHEENDE
jgi:aspartyl-tRNA(Asn)/glutamyl-tRNA(Gln) amidotransferase subunit C